MTSPLGAAGEIAIRSLIERAPLASSLAAAYKSAGYKLALVGGPVRDAILGRLGNDLDFTTDALPLESKKILKIWGEIFGIPELNSELSQQNVVTQLLKSQHIAAINTIQKVANPKLNSVTISQVIYRAEISRLTAWHLN